MPPAWNQGLSDLDDRQCIWAIGHNHFVDVSRRSSTRKFIRNGCRILHQQVFCRDGTGEICANVPRCLATRYPSVIIIIFHIAIVPDVGITATPLLRRHATLKASMEGQANQHEPVREDTSQSGANRNPELLTVSQAYDYLISEGLPRSKKTIRKWCRLNHVEWKEIAVLGGAKWIITRSSLDARIAEERLIDASLTLATGTNPSEQRRTDTSVNPSVPVRDDALVEVLKEQLAHERDARTASEAKNRELIDKYHEISLASAQMGVEIGKGMQEQARARRLAVQSESDSGRSTEIAAGSRILEPRRAEEPRAEGTKDADNYDSQVDNPDRASGPHPVQ